MSSLMRRWNPKTPRMAQTTMKAMLRARPDRFHGSWVCLELAMEVETMEQGKRIVGQLNVGRSGAPSPPQLPHGDRNVDAV